MEEQENYVDEAEADQQLINQLRVASTADLMDCIRDNARNLSLAIKNANARGLNVHIQKAPEGSPDLFQIVYLF